MPDQRLLRDLEQTNLVEAVWAQLLGLIEERSSVGESIDLTLGCRRSGWHIRVTWRPYGSREVDAGGSLLGVGTNLERAMRSLMQDAGWPDPQPEAR